MSEIKRPVPSGGADQASKRAKSSQAKGRKQWRVPRTNRDGTHTLPPTIEPGDQGIWATCDMNKEAKCVAELKGMFYEFAEELYGPELEKMRNEEDAKKAEGEEAVEGEEATEKREQKGEKPEFDIEADIAAELKSMRRPTTEPLFTNVRMDVQCVLFLKTRPPIHPTSFIQHICRSLHDTAIRQTRFCKRLSPMTMMGKANEAGLENVAKNVLGEHFWGEENVKKGRKFAIRPNIRNHNKILNRDLVIQTVASLVGPGHKVDLNNPELIILVEVYTNICGMSVVSGPDYDELKRFNLAEIGMPTVEKEDAGGGD